MTIPVPTEPPAIAGGRPPAEHRVLGLDRRTFKLPLIVVAIYVLWAVIAPAINGAVDYDDPVRAGDALIITPSATMAPPVGWGVQSGVRVSDDTRGPLGSTPTTAVVGDGVQLTTQAGSFTGDARALVQQVSETDEKLSAKSAFTVKGEPRTITVDGQRGVAQEFKLLNSEGAVFGFVVDGTGVSVVVTGSEDALDRAATKLGHAIASIDFDAKELS